MKKKLFILIVVFIVLLAVAYITAQRNLIYVDKDENQASEEPDIDVDKIIDGNYDVLTDYDFMSPEAARLIAEACVSYSKKNTLYDSGIVSAKETRFLQYGKTILYVEVVTKDDTHLFFRVPGHQTKYGNWIKEIWKDDVGDDGTILLIYVYD